MVIIIGLFYIYCILGCVVGCMKWAQEEWPKQKVVEDTVGGLGTYKAMDLDKTLLFALCCGPLFWLAIGFFKCFKGICGILKDKEETDESK